MNEPNYSQAAANSTHLEQEVLGAMMFSEYSLRESLGILLTDEVFYHQHHRAIYRAIKALQQQGDAVDNNTVMYRLAQDGTLKSVIAKVDITQLWARAKTGRSVKDYCHRLVEMFTKREIAKLASALLTGAGDPMQTARDLLSDGQANISRLIGGLETSKSVHSGTLVDQVLDSIEAATQTPGGLTGIPSGLTKVDKATGGWQPSDLIVIAARPGMGKTSIALFMVFEAAKRGYPGVFFSLEMGDKQLVLKMITSELGQYTVSQLRNGKLDGGLQEAQSLRQRVQHARTAPVYLNDKPGLRMDELRAEAARMKVEHGIRWVVVDYLQLMGGEGKGNRVNEIGDISRGLKLMAKELNVPVFALSQLSRDVEKRGGDFRPRTSDLRDSGAIEQDADVIVFPFRAEEYQIYEDEMGDNIRNTTEVIFAKHRNGALGSVRVGSTMHNGRYFDLEEAMPVYTPAVEQYGPRTVELRTAGSSEFDTED